MRNDDVEVATRPEEKDPAATPLLPSPAPPLLIVAADEDAVCVDDLCLPAEARP